MMNTYAFATFRSLSALGTLLIAMGQGACTFGTDDAPDPAAQGSSSIAAEVSAVERFGSDDGIDSATPRHLGTIRKDARHFRQVVVFGDSLSDAGTYDVGTMAAVGGGKFTTNPGPVWAELVGLFVHAPVTPFREGFGGVSRVLGGSDFAMGGARVSEQPGINCMPDPATGGCTAALTIPVTGQIDDYFLGSGDRFTGDQLVLVLTGANDVFFQLGVFQAKAEAGVPLADAQADALAAVQQAGNELVAQVQRIISNGATHVVVLNIPDISRTPFGAAPSNAPVRPLVGAMVRAFNGALALGLEGTSALRLDLEGELNRVLDNPAAYLVRDAAVPACDPAKIAVVTAGLEQTGSSLFCSPMTLVARDAPLTHLFADAVHPSTLGHAIVARFVVIGLRERGWL